MPMPDMIDRRMQRRRFKRAVPIPGRPCFWFEALANVQRPDNAATAQAAIPKRLIAIGIRRIDTKRSGDAAPMIFVAKLSLVGNMLRLDGRRLDLGHHSHHQARMATTASAAVHIAIGRQ